MAAIISQTRNESFDDLLATPQTLPAKPDTAPAPTTPDTPTTPNPTHTPFRKPEPSIAPCPTPNPDEPFPKCEVEAFVKSGRIISRG
jgi:hypothetical protein